jgi:sterol desaturase/sphingolipid hydroxylase (fatty acid hydroxylase superfamily)
MSAWSGACVRSGSFEAIGRFVLRYRSDYEAKGLSFGEGWVLRQKVVGEFAIGQVLFRPFQALRAGIPLTSLDRISSPLIGAPPAMEKTMLKTVLQWSIWPICLAAHTAPIVAASFFAPQLLSPVAAITTVVLIFALLGIEQRLSHRADWSVRGDSEVWRDVGHAIAYAALAINASRFLFLVVLASAISFIGLADVFGVWPKGSPIWAQVIIVIIFGDALEYFYHRICHTYPILWRLHAIHHTPVRMHTLKGGRHHFIYAFGRGLAVWLPLLVLGAPAELVYWQYSAETITGLVGHANIRFRIPAFMHRLVVSGHSASPAIGTASRSASGHRIAGCGAWAIPLHAVGPRFWHDPQSPTSRPCPPPSDRRNERGHAPPSPSAGLCRGGD